MRPEESWRLPEYCTNRPRVPRLTRPCYGAEALPSQRIESRRPRGRQRQVTAVQGIPSACGVRDTRRAMAEESTTPDLVELVHRSVDAVNHRDLDTFAAPFSSDSVWDLSPMGLGTYEGMSAIRAFVEDWAGAYEEFELALDEVLDIGNGVVFAVVLQRARLADSAAEVRMRYASVNSLAEGKFECITNYTEIDEARVAAERLAEERGRDS
jgi:ketosteroid isomerase-like protein